MIQNFKRLFVKAGQEGPGTKKTQSGGYAFPASYLPALPPGALPDATLAEVLKAYENGLETLNRSGYDFYAFYQAITTADNVTGPAYQMAYHMARALDKTITPGKPIGDAAFYLGKVGEMYRQYVTQGQQKLQALREKNTLSRRSSTPELRRQPNAWRSSEPNCSNYRPTSTTTGTHWQHSTKEKIPRKRPSGKNLVPMNRPTGSASTG
jgi:hypothetical protein